MFLCFLNQTLTHKILNSLWCFEKKMLEIIQPERRANHDPVTFHKNCQSSANHWLTISY